MRTIQGSVDNVSYHQRSTRLLGLDGFNCSCWDDMKAMTGVIRTGLKYGRTSISRTQMDLEKKFDLRSLRVSENGVIGAG